MNFKTILIIGVTAIQLACNRIDYFEDQENISTPTEVLIHAAAGDSEEYRRNTLEAVKYACSLFDGVEVDIAVSKDGTLWMTHDDKVLSSSMEEQDFFIRTSDDYISQVVDESGKPYYDRLEETLNYMGGQEVKRTISLDVKRPKGIEVGGSFNKVVEEIDRLVRVNGLVGKVKVESGSLSFLKNMAKKGSAETYFMSYGNLELGISNSYSNGLTGVSFNYGREDELIKQAVGLVHEKGLKIQAYYINNEAIKEVYPMGVDYIQTDHFDFYEILNH